MIDRAAQLSSADWEIATLGENADIYVRGGFMLPIGDIVRFRWRVVENVDDALALNCPQTNDCQYSDLTIDFGLQQLSRVATEVSDSVRAKLGGSVQTRVYFVSCFKKIGTDNVTDIIHDLITTMLFRELTEDWQSSTEFAVIGLANDAVEICRSGNIPPDRKAGADYEIGGWISRQEYGGVRIDLDIFIVEREISREIFRFTEPEFYRSTFFDELADHIRWQLISVEY